MAGWKPANDGWHWRLRRASYTENNYGSFVLRLQENREGISAFVVKAVNVWRSGSAGF